MFTVWLAAWLIGFSIAYTGIGFHTNRERAPLRGGRDYFSVAVVSAIWPLWIPIVVVVMFWLTYVVSRALDDDYGYIY